MNYLLQSVGGNILQLILFISGLESREYGTGDPLHWPRDNLYPQKLALTSSTSGGRSACIVRPLTKATEIFVTYYQHDSRNILIVTGKY
jgi:hypothetical protein